MNNFVNEVMVAIYTGMPLTLCTPAGFKDLWNENYLDPGLPRCSLEGCAPPDEHPDEPAPTFGKMLYIHGAATSMQQAGRHPTALEGLKRFLYQQLFVLRPELKQEAESMERHLGLQRGAYVGVHIRRGDKKREADFFRSTKAFVDMAEELCRTTGTQKILLATDDGSVFSEFRELLAKDLQVVEQPRLSAATYAERGNLKMKTELVLLMDLTLLVWSVAYVGTASSNLDRFVWFQRDPASQSISLDDGGNFLYRSC
jgi:hypothetical protein